MANDGSITFGTRLDNSELEKGLKKAEKQVESLKAKIESEESNRNVLKEQMDDAAYAVEHYKARLKELESEYGTLKASMASASAPQQAAILEQMRQNMVLQSAARGLLAESQTELSGIESKWQASTDRLRGYRVQLDGAMTGQRQMQAQLSQMYKARDGQYYSSRMSYAFERIREAGSRAANAISASHARTAKALESGYRAAASRTRAALKGLVPFVTISAGFALLFKKMREFAMQNEQVQQGITGLKAACNGFASGLASLIAPALLGFLRVVTTMIMTLARLIDSIFKTDFAGHIAAQLQAASSSGQAAQSTAKQAKATDRLAKSVKEANRQLMGFDELNVLNADQSDDNAGALDDIADDASGGAGGGFDPSMLLDGIDETLAKIMLIAGAALLAIGIILTVSGANIPLGLALMAIGALMLYTAYAEQWDKLPAEVQNTISLIMAIVAGALIVIGVILCATGNIPLGIAFIIAGAALFVVNAMINPDFMAGMVDFMVQHILGVIAGALIVIGVILVVVGHPLVGVAFIIAGAALFVMDVVLNWDLMPTSVQEFLVTMISVIAGALIVLGVILCAVGHPVLGIAAILVGILMFVTAAALDENETPNKIRKFLTEMVPVIGKALVVVGVLLCVVGNLPLGIAAIVFGIAIWVVGEALTEGVPAEKIMDFLKAMLPEIGKALVVVGLLICVLSGGSALPVGIAAIIAGVAIWVVGEVLNENFTKEKIQSFIDDVLPVIAGAMIVLGVILLVFSAGTAAPIAIGLIIAGIGALVFTQADIDWDFILNKIKEVWDDICNWWDSNVAHIFTIEFWQGIFSSIADGLWSAITGVGDTVSGFFNGIGEGIGGILSGLGQPFSWVVPSFDFAPPRLATGAVIPPNRQFMAVLGDQRYGNNLEGPESMFRQIVREEAGAGGNVEGLLVQLLDAVREGKSIYMDGDKVGSTVSAYQASMQRVSGW